MQGPGDHGVQGTWGVRGEERGVRGRGVHTGYHGQRDRLVMSEQANERFRATQVV